MSLNAQILEPARPRDGARAIVLLHGRGADPSDLAGLRAWLPDEDALVLPQAPHAAAPWGYGQGWAWYRYEGEDRPDVVSFAASQQALDELLDELDERLRFRAGTIVVGGFSQGGTSALGYALSHPGRVDGVLNFSGFVPRHPDVGVTAESVAGTRFFWGHGLHDPSIPFEMATRGREALIAAGADLEARDYPMGHGILADEIRDALAWLRRLPQR